MTHPRAGRSRSGRSGGSQGHDITSATWPCEGALIGVFIQQASLAHLDTGCMAAIPAPAFPLTLQALAGG